MVLHGAYVFTGVAEMWARVAERGCADAAARAAVCAQQSRLALDVVIGAGVLTGLGDRLVSGLRTTLDELHHRIDIPEVERSEIEHRLRLHAELHSGASR
jgi:hypothetical protein